MSLINRSLKDQIIEDLDSKIVLLSGPRQVGKTTLSQNLYENQEYLTYDDPEDRLLMMERSWRRDAEIVILDELHKQDRWKQYLKGIYDKEGVRPRLMVTGSAKLDVFRKVGDSLAGRFFSHRAHPLDLKELRQQVTGIDLEEALQRLLRFGGFPEPFFKESQVFYERWKKSHHDVILRQDMLELSDYQDIQLMETLIAMLRHRVGSPVSYASLSRDLQRSPQTIKNWLKLLEDLLILFRVTPYHRNISRSLLKEPKYYFYDVGLVPSENPGACFENLVATALLKECHRVEDSLGRRSQLHYLRTKEGREVDFCVCFDEKPDLLVEAKVSEATPDPSLKWFHSLLPNAKAIQLVQQKVRERHFESGLQVQSAVEWLSAMDFSGA